MGALSLFVSLHAPQRRLTGTAETGDDVGDTPVESSVEAKGFRGERSDMSRHAFGVVPGTSKEQHNHVGFANTRLAGAAVLEKLKRDARIASCCRRWR